MISQVLVSAYIHHRVVTQSINNSSIVNPPDSIVYSMTCHIQSTHDKIHQSDRPHGMYVHVGFSQTLHVDKPICHGWLA